MYFNVEGCLSSEKSDQKEQHQCADNGSNDVVDQACADGYSHLPEKPAADEGAENTDDNIAQQAKTIALADKSGQPAGSGADDKGKNKSVQFHRTFCFR